MNKSEKIEFKRVFLIESLPEPLTRADPHIQFFDNYISGTRLRIRSVRTPETKEWGYFLQSRQISVVDGYSTYEVSEIELNEAEHDHFETFEGNEIRKNRYAAKVTGVNYEFDVYLGSLWGLNRAICRFSDLAKMNTFERPSFAFLEITNEEFFRDESLVDRSFADIQAEVGRLIGTSAEK
jgi:CYTH domain-containing protein